MKSAIAGVAGMATMATGIVNGLFEITCALIPEERKYPSISCFLVLLQALECGGRLVKHARDLGCESVELISSITGLL